MEGNQENGEFQRHSSLTGDSTASLAWDHTWAECPEEAWDSFSLLTPDPALKLVTQSGPDPNANTCFFLPLTYDTC